MILNNNAFANERDDRSEQGNNDQPGAYRVEDDNNPDGKDLERSFLFGGDTDKKPVREGKAMGGENFGKNNLTPSGDDKNNPSQNAGYDNAYFARTEPSEEHPEDGNFTAEKQSGSPDYDKAQADYTIKSETPKPEKVERGNGINDRPHPQEPYQEGTADNEEPNIPGPNELPDQQKVGEGNEDDPYPKG